MLVNFVYGGRFGIKTITAIKIVEHNINFNIFFNNANKNPILALEQSPIKESDDTNTNQIPICEKT